MIDSLTIHSVSSDATLVADTLQTPAYVFDLARASRNLSVLQPLREAGCSVLYSIKALPLADLLRHLSPSLDGFSVSSLYEAQTARDSVGFEKPLHLATPGIRGELMPHYSELCTHITFNSLGQYQRLAAQIGNASPGIRINPKISFADDVRYDPCRPASKLGVDWRELLTGLPTGIEGLHVHSVFSCTELSPLLHILANVIEPIVKRYQRQLRWLNLGGGYLYGQIDDLRPLLEQIKRLRERYSLDIYIEPGKAIIGNAGYLVTRVLDVFVSDGQMLAILDTTVNHHPEVFEYQRRLRLLQETSSTGVSVILAGCSCLAGDIFGEYQLERMPEVGDLMVFADVGAYSLVKAQRFNGIELPDVYLCSDTTQLNFCNK